VRILPRFHERLHGLADVTRWRDDLSSAGNGRRTDLGAGLAGPGGSNAGRLTPTSAACRLRIGGPKPTLEELLAANAEYDWRAA